MLELNTVQHSQARIHTPEVWLQLPASQHSTLTGKSRALRKFKQERDNQISLGNGVMRKRASFLLTAHSACMGVLVLFFIRRQSAAHEQIRN